MRTSILVRSLAISAFLPAAAAQAAAQAGVSAAVRGEVMLARAQAVGRTVASGEAIFLQDRIQSGDRSGMQILLLDETTFTIGPDSEVEVDEFVYDPATNAGKLGAHVAKGVFRFVTGKIAKEQPSNVTLTLPAGNIGIRGTIVAGMSNPASRASLVVLLGEGPENAADSEAGSIDVCNAGSCTHVARPGFGVRIDGVEAPPTPAFRLGDDTIDRMLRGVVGDGGIVERAAIDARDEGVSPSGALAEDPRGDRKDAREAWKRLARLDRVDEATGLAAQDGQLSQEERLLGGLRGFPDGPTTFDQLRSIPQGKIHYAQTGVPLTGGQYGFSIDVDLGARTFGGGGSAMWVTGLRNGVAHFPVAQSYAGASGFSNFSFSSNAISGTGCGSYCTAHLAVLPQNVNGFVAAKALHEMVIDDYLSMEIDHGAGVAPALPGATP